MRKPIWNTPEYKLASKEMQGWAFTHKGNYKSAVDAAKEQGVKVDGRTVKVKTNTGEMFDVPVDMSLYSIQPKASIKRAYATVDGKRVSVYLVKGTSPKNKSAQYFTYQDFERSEDFATLKKEISDAFEKDRNEHHEMLRKELAKSHPPLAKKASKELPALAKEDGAEQKIFDWFEKNGFDMHHLKPSDLKSFIKELKDSGHVTADFEISAHADSWGHQTGTSVQIDFANKKIGKYGWSSDD